MKPTPEESQPANWSRVEAKATVSADKVLVTTF